jgi:Sortase domain
VRTLFSALRNRVLPAVMTAAGVTLIAAGLLSYSGKAAAADPTITAEPTIVAAADPGTSLGFPSLPPIEVSPTATALPSASPNANRVATRVVVQALGIDLPIVKPRGGSTTYPQCNVAMYIQTPLKQPGQGGATYLYAHARDGMFGPIYERAIQKKSGGPKSMIGMIVQIYTSDDQLFEYEVTEVRLHQLNLDDASRATTEELWLQTSEGPKGTPGKTQLLALPLITLPANHKAAHPVPHPVNCA